MKGLSLSQRLPLVLELTSLYLKFVALNRWDSLSVLQARPGEQNGRTATMGETIPCVLLGAGCRQESEEAEG